MSVRYDERCCHELLERCSFFSEIGRSKIQNYAVQFITFHWVGPELSAAPGIHYVTGLGREPYTSGSTFGAPHGESSRISAHRVDIDTHRV